MYLRAEFEQLTLSFIVHWNKVSCVLNCSYICKKISSHKKYTSVNNEIYKGTNV